MIVSVETVDRDNASTLGVLCSLCRALENRHSDSNLPVAVSHTPSRTSPTAKPI